MQGWDAGIHIIRNERLFQKIYKEVAYHDIRNEGLFEKIYKEVEGEYVDSLYYAYNIVHVYGAGMSCICCQMFNRNLCLLKLEKGTIRLK